MKTKSIVQFVVLLSASARLAGAADNPNEALQKGLLEEEANHNLDAAIQAYQSVVNQFDDQRKIAATAVFRLAECYRKQGKTNEAVAQYERVVQDFADQDILVGPSERNLAALRRGSGSGPGGPIAVTTVTDPDQLKLLKDEIKLVEKEIAATEARFKVGKAEFADIAKTKKELFSLQRQLPENAGSAVQRNLIDEQIQLVERLLADKKKQVEVGAAPPLDTVPLERELLGLKRELITISKGSFTARVSGDAESAAAGDEEAKEIQRLRAVIKNSPDLINAKDNQGDTPLHNAASKGQLDVARFLLENKAQVNAKNSSGSTPLHFAARYGHKAMVELLLARGADVNAKENSLVTPLHVAASRGYHAVAEALLAHGADLNARDWRGATPLHSAAETDYAGMGRLLLENKADIDAKDTEGNTPLNNAVRQGKADMAKLLGEKGANVNIPGKFGDAPLHSAIGNFGNFSEELFKVILGGKPDLELKNGDDMTPLQMAVYLRNARAVELLLKARANPNPKFDGSRAVFNRSPQDGRGTFVGFDGHGKTPLHLEVEHQNKKIVEALLANGADVNAKDDYGATPLHRAIQQLDKGIVEVLLAHKADVNAKDSVGDTPLHHAVALQAGKTIIELLLAGGADVNARDNDAKTPLDLTKSPRSPTLGVANAQPFPGVGFPKRATPDEIADLLRKHGAKE